MRHAIDDHRDPLRHSKGDHGIVLAVDPAQGRVASSLSAIHASPTASVCRSRNYGSRSRLSPLPTRITIRQRADTKSASPMSVFASTTQSLCREQNWPMKSFDLDEPSAGWQSLDSPATDLAEGVRRHERSTRRGLPSVPRPRPRFGSGSAGERQDWRTRSRLPTRCRNSSGRPKPLTSPDR